MQQRIRWIDSMKGIAICLIVMTHSGMADYPGFVGRFAAFGKYAVELFFIISVYLTLQSYERFISQKRENGLKSNLSWYKRRIIKILPVYYICLLLYGICLGGESFFYGTDGGITLWNIISHILFLNVFIPKYINSIIGVEWYLAVLVLIILFTPYIYKFAKSKIRSIVFLIITIFVYVIWSKCEILISYNPAETDIYKSYWLWMSFIPNLPTIALGVLLYHITKTKVYVSKYDSWIGSLSVLAFALWMIYGSMYGYTSLYYCPIYFQWALWFFLIIISQYIRSNIVFDNVIWAFLGKNSLVIYLIHPFIFYHLGKIKMFSSGVGLIAKFGVGLIISLTIAWIYNLVEGIIKSKFLKNNEK